MKKLVLLVFIVFYGINIQSQTLSKFYNLVNGNEYGSEIFYHENGFLLLTNGICDPGTGNSKGCTSILTLDSNGVIMGNHTFVDWFGFAPNQYLYPNNDTIYIFGLNEKVLRKKTIWNIYKTNIQGDSLGFFKDDYFDEVIMVPEAIQIKNDFLYLLGRYFNFETGNGGDIVILKMDKYGNRIKEERFKDIAKPEFGNTAFDLVQSKDGYFVLSGRSIDKSYKDYFQSFIIKFDDDLNIVWSKGINRYSRPINFPHLAATIDSGIVVCSGIYMPDIINIVGNDYKKYELYPSLIQKIDRFGEIEWSDTLFTKRERGTVGAQKRIIKMKSLSNGDIIGCGYYKDVDNRIWGWIFRYSIDGELKWEKKYEEKKYPKGYSKFYDITETENGDIVVTGLMVSKIGWGNDNGYTWLLKLDKNGCFTPNCEKKDTVQLIYTKSDLITNIDYGKDIMSNIDRLQIYPNPAYEYIRIKVNQSQEVYTVKIFDILGNEVYNNTYESGDQINIKGFKSGMYVLVLRDKKEDRFTGKFIVE